MKLPKKTPPTAIDPRKKFIIKDGEYIKVDRTPQEDRFYTQIVYQSNY